MLIITVASALALMLRSATMADISAAMYGTMVKSGMDVGAWIKPMTE